MDEDRLAQIAQQLAARMRDDDPTANARWFFSMLPDPDDWFRFAFVACSAIPVDRPWSELVEWHTGPVDPLEVRRQQWRDAQHKRRAA